MELIPLVLAAPIALALFRLIQRKRNYAKAEIHYKAIEGRIIDHERIVG